MSEMYNVVHFLVKLDRKQTWQMPQEPGSDIATMGTLRRRRLEVAQPDGRVLGIKSQELIVQQPSGKTPPEVGGNFSPTHWFSVSG